MTESAFWFDKDGNPVPKDDIMAVYAEIVRYDTNGKEIERIYADIEPAPVAEPAPTKET